MHEAAQLGHDGHRREAAWHDGLMCSAVQLGAAAVSHSISLCYLPSVPVHGSSYCCRMRVGSIPVVPYLLIII
jgi:hypothetical protein